MTIRWKGTTGRSDYIDSISATPQENIFRTERRNFLQHLQDSVPMTESTRASYVEFNVEQANERICHFNRLHFLDCLRYNRAESGDIGRYGCISVSFENACLEKRKHYQFKYKYYINITSLNLYNCILYIWSVSQKCSFKQKALQTHKKHAWIPIISNPCRGGSPLLNYARSAVNLHAFCGCPPLAQEDFSIL